MRKFLRFLLLISAGAIFFLPAAYGQDDQQPSLGDVARQARLQKQQKDAQAQNAQAQDKQDKDEQGQSKDAQSATAAKGENAQDNNAQGNDGKDASAKDAQPKTAKKIITNDEIPAHVDSTWTSIPAAKAAGEQPQPDAGNGKASPEYWKGQIQAQKSAIANMEAQIKSLSDSIEYAGANCVANCAQWNERQQQKQQQVDAMKLQLQTLQDNLADMQETARKQGYGSSVYDP
jgi:hypothetical protein